MAAVDAVLSFPFVGHLADALSARPAAKAASPYAVLAPTALALAGLVLFVSTAKSLVEKNDRKQTKTSKIHFGLHGHDAAKTGPTQTRTSAPSPTPFRRSPPLAPSDAPPEPSSCGAPEEVGAGAPPPLGEQLRALVHGSAELRRDGAGEAVTGCMGAARQERGQPGVFTMEGRCDGALRSLGVVSASQRALLLLQQRAVVGREEARRSQLLGATDTLEQWRREPDGADA